MKFLERLKKRSIRKLIKYMPVNSKLSLREKFLKYHGYYPDLVKPRSLSEKLQWIKLHYNLEKLSPYVDKYLVRDFVQSLTGERYLVPLIGVYDRFEDISFNLLPDQFVIKATHGSGWNIIVKDKKQADWELIGKEINRWLAKNYGTKKGETCYDTLRGRIIIEEYLESTQNTLYDYKFYCCNGEPLGLHVDFDRYGNHTYRIYNTEWYEFQKIGPVTIEPPVLPKPPNLDEMLDLCRKLSTGFSYVRVDLYNPNNRIYFSELTFLPANGWSPFDPVWSDYYFGEKLDVYSYSPELNETGTLAERGQ